MTIYTSVCAKTLATNCFRQYKHLIEEYESVKQKTHPQFKTATEFYQANKIKKQTFLKYYNRYKKGGVDSDLSPRKRGPKFFYLLTDESNDDLNPKNIANVVGTVNSVNTVNNTGFNLDNDSTCVNSSVINGINAINGECAVLAHYSRKYPPTIINKVIDLRKKSYNKYEINSALKIALGTKDVPSVSTIYRIFKKVNLNKKTVTMQEEKRKIITKKAGELGHVDCHYLPKGLIRNEPNKRYYVLGVIDDCTRVCWVEVLENVKSLSAMFAILQSLNRIYDEFHFKIIRIMTDNGSEFTCKSDNEEAKNNHPVERLFKELGIKHTKIKPYRPQTNGKIERFWRIFDEDVIENADFASLEEFKDVVLQYNVYYNHCRQHQSLSNKTPVEFLQEVKKMEA